MKHLGDITALSGATVPPVDIITGGSPCQDLSVAGKRAGLNGERSGLFMEQIRIIKEMRENDRRNGRTGKSIRPQFMVFENVLGLFSSNKGEDFRIVLEETAKVADESAVIPRPPKGKWTPAGCIVGDGWSIAWRVHDAQFWGVPQRRKRLALVADFAGESAAEILFERKSVPGNNTESKEEREGIAAQVQRGIDKTSNFLYAEEAYGKWNAIDKSAPLRAVGGTYGGGSETVSVSSTVRRLMPLEAERLQGFPDGWTDIGDWIDSKGKKHKGESDSPRYKALGNSIALPFWEWMAERMVKHLPDKPTMGSLFDGISGFCLVYKKCGCEPIWSSEVEEFCIAVAKKHFGDDEKGEKGDYEQYL